MARYFTVAAASPIDLIFSYRGDDGKNSLGETIPSEGSANGFFQLPAEMSASVVERFVATTFVNLAFDNPNTKFLIRLSDHNVITYWATALKEPYLQAQLP